MQTNQITKKLCKKGELLEQEKKQKDEKYEELLNFEKKLEEFEKKQLNYHLEHYKHSDSIAKELERKIAKYNQKIRLCKHFEHAIKNHETNLSMCLCEK